MSMDDSKTFINKAVEFGACDYWVKPLQNMWAHVLKKHVSQDQRRKDDNKIR